MEKGKGISGPGMRMGIRGVIGFQRDQPAWRFRERECGYHGLVCKLHSYIVSRISEHGLMLFLPDLNI